MMEKENFKFNNFIFEENKNYNKYLSEFENIYEKNKKIDKFWSVEKPKSKKSAIYELPVDTPNPLPNPTESTPFELPLETPKPVLNPAIFPVPEVVDLPPLPDIKPSVEPVQPLPKPAHYKPDTIVPSEFLTSDRFENHPAKFTPAQARKARFLNRIASGEEGIDVDKATEIDISAEEVKAAVKVANIFNEYMQQRFNDLGKIPNWDQIKGNMQFLLMRFMVQHFNNKPLGIGDLKEQALVNLTQQALDQGILAFSSTLETLPLYDQLYEELDQLRSTGRRPLEVYLGRDGVYGYVGRKAQDVARRRNMGWKKRKEQKQKGENPGLNLKYLVYPRRFRDNLSPVTKIEYLEKEGINTYVDPVFYDTGFVGTIPEQILKLLGYPEEEMDDRMKLLSAKKDKRRVKGISDLERSNIVNKIEYSAKSEEVAVGLYKDQETGQIRPVAEPTSPQEQYMFEMIKLAVTSHYFYKEKIKKSTTAKLLSALRLEFGGHEVKK